MQMLDISRIAELSTIGLLADKILFVLEQHPAVKNIPESERSIFNLAQDFMRRAVDGLSSVENLKVSHDTALAVGSYEIVVNAWWPTQANNNSKELRKEMRTLLKSIRKICRDIVKTGQVEKKEERKRFYQFFNALSEFTSKEHSVLLRRATKSEFYL